jgi:hypothetical protein
MLFFKKPSPPLTKIESPTPDGVLAKFKPEPKSASLVKPNQTPTEYVEALEKNKCSGDAVKFLAHGMPERDSVWWACQSSQKVAPKLNSADSSALTAAQNWVKNPTPDTQAAAAAAAAKTDFKGPGGWAAQAAAWSKPSGAAASGAGGGAAAPAGLAGAAVAGSVLLAAGLVSRPAMPEAQKPVLEIPKAALPKVETPVLEQPEIPPVDENKFSKMMQPFLDIGKEVASGKNTWA